MSNSTHDVIRIRRKTLIRGVGAAVIALLALYVLAVTIDTIISRIVYSYDHVRGDSIRFDPDKFIGRRVRMRGYLRGDSSACMLDGVPLVYCAGDNCGCPVAEIGHYDTYEVYATVDYCSDSEDTPCLVNLTRLYRLEGAGENLMIRGSLFPVTPTR